MALKDKNKGDQVILGETELYKEQEDVYTLLEAPSISRKVYSRVSINRQLIAAQAEVTRLEALIAEMDIADANYIP
jgi:hypothetical protein